MNSKNILLVVALLTIAPYSWSSCDDRIVERVVPKWVMHSERVLIVNEKCVVNVDYNLDEEGIPTIVDSTTEIEDCQVFKRNVELSISKYIFKKGTNQNCSITITLKLEKE